MSQALNQAGEAGYDLAEISANAQPPVVKILDWGKYRYEQTKQLQKSRKNQKLVEIKQVRLGIKIGQHDFDVKLNRARKFIGQGNKVKVSLLFRGREITHPDLGRTMLNRFMTAIEDIAVQEQLPQMSGRDLNMVIAAKKEIKPPKDTQNAETKES